MENNELEISPKVLSSLIELVHKITGITMTEKKKILLQSRLRPRLRKLGLLTYESYLEHLRDDKSEIEHFTDCVTTNETLFFRTPRVWDFFGKNFLKAYSQKGSGETLRIWSAASSSGEEIYSIAMTLLEYKKVDPKLKFELIATDISQQILSEARIGVYTQKSMDGLMRHNPLLREKYFDLGKESFILKAEVKECVRFIQHNLLTLLSVKESFDVIFLRNVLIYFNEADQKRVVMLAIEKLKGKGYLILGESESLGRFETGLSFVEPLVYQK